MSRLRGSKRVWAAAAAAGALTITLAACGGGKAAEKTAGTSYSMAVTANFLAHFTPGKSGSTNLDYALFTPLTQVDAASGEARNAVASAIDTTDDTTWTIKIKKGWTFHNGEAVTAQSFADSWNATAYAPNAFTNGYLLADIAGYSDLNPVKGKPSATTLSGVKVVDPYTLKVTLIKPLSMLPYLLAQSTFAPMPKAAFSDLSAYDRLPIGNGPYKMAGQGVTTGATKVVLQRFDTYAGTDKGKAETVEVRSYQDETAAYRDFQAGTLDVAMLTGNNLTNAAARYKDQLVQVPLPAVVYLGFPMWDKRFADIRVRQAFSMALNREAIVKSLLGGFGTPANGLAGKSVPGGGAADCASCSFDPQQAKSLLQAAGGWKGPLKLWTYQDPTNSVVLEAIANQLRTGLGITSVTTQAQPADQLYPNLAAHKIDGPVLLYMGAGYPHLYALVDQLFSKGSATNVTGFADARFDALLGQAAAAKPQEALALTQQAARTAMDTLPLAPVYLPSGGLVHSTRTGHVTPEFLGGASVSATTVN
jgi:peptide/nickel transport system substrate-binding protein/oligopeptide transport system substrate-binding protein